MKTPILFDVYEIKEAIKVCKCVCVCVHTVDTAQGRTWTTWCVLALTSCCCHFGSDSPSGWTPSALEGDLPVTPQEESRVPFIVREYPSVSIFMTWRELGL